VSVSSTEHLDRLAFILYDRPAGRNVIGHAIDTIERLRKELSDHKERKPYSRDQVSYEALERRIMELSLEVEALEDDLELAQAGSDRFEWCVTRVVSIKRLRNGQADISFRDESPWRSDEEAEEAIIRIGEFIDDQLLAAANVTIEGDGFEDEA